MTPQHERRTPKNHRVSSRAGAGPLASLLLALALAWPTPARAHHDIQEQPELHQGTVEPHRHEAGIEEPHDHYHAHAYGDVRPHQHAYTHTHWHTHVLEDGTVIHHKHPHSHRYWHYGPDETEEERVTRVEEDREKAPPNEESASPQAGTRFVKPGQGGDGPEPSLK